MADTQILLASCPQGEIAHNNFKVEKVDIPQLSQDAVLVRTLYLSVDPYMRPMMESKAPHKYEPGKVLYGAGIGLVMNSKNGNFKEGDLVCSDNLSWKEIEAYSGNDIARLGIKKLDPLGLPLEESLYTTGMTGTTAWLGMQLIGQPKAGSTVLISGACGAVGCLAGQIAKLRGCKVFGLVSTQEKCELLTKHFGFDKAFNYKTEDLNKALQKEFPNGIDFFWDNVGGEILDAALCNMANFGRIIVCGSICAYNKDAPITEYFNITTKRLTVQGFMASDHKDKYEQAQKEMAHWYKQGKIKTKLTVVEGMDNMVDAFLGVLKPGGHQGKLIVKVSQGVTPGAAK